MPSPGCRLTFVSLATPWMCAAGSVADQAARTIADLGLQTELPRDPPQRDFSLSIPDILLWVIGIIGLAILLYNIRDLVWRRRFTAARSDDLALDADRQAAHLARAEHFAGLGLFVEAIHELLLEAVRELQGRASIPLKDSRTSREILRAPGLSEPARDALDAIVRRVEWTWFGARAATRDDYLACRDHFQRLRGAP